MSSAVRFRKVSRAALLTLLLVSLGMGMFGTTMHFIPEPSSRLAIFLVAVVCVAVLTTFGWRIRVAGSTKQDGLVPTPVKLMFGLLVFLYFFYVCLYVTIPALVTSSFGVPASRTYVIENLEQGGSKAWLCPYRIKLRGAAFVLSDSFCVNEQFARKYAVGQQIRLTGKQTLWGFRFLNAS